MKIKKTTIEIICICDICEFTAIRKLDIDDNKIHHKFENEELCKECFQTDQNSREARKGKNSLKIDYYYK